MASERRAALLGWAEEVDGLIVEDDYDSELRYDRGPVGALQGLAPERVCHVGSAGKRLAPGAAARLGAVAVVADRRAHLRQGAGRRRHPGARAAGAGRLHRPRRARPPPAADAAALPRPPRGHRAARWPRACPRRASAGSPAGLYTRGRRCPAERLRAGAAAGRGGRRASPSRAWRRAGSRAPGRRGCCSATPTSPSRRSSAGSSCWPARSTRLRRRVARLQSSSASARGHDRGERRRP